MKFNSFLEILPKVVNQPLPALTAHAKMAPLERLPSLSADYYKKFNPRESAVMMLFYPKHEDTFLVLMKRNTYPGVHSAQISFPGGKREPEDKDLEETALRETMEELGVDPAIVSVVKAFTQVYIPPSNFLVTPYLGIAHQTPVFDPNPSEVDTIVELRVEELVDDAIVINTELRTSYAAKMAVPAFLVQGHVVWGATAMMLSELKETINNALK